MELHRVGPAHVNDYINLPWALYRDDRCWVPPLKAEMAKLMDVRKNPFFRHAVAEHFIVTSAGRTAGRIAACIYPSPAERPDISYCSFGFFESEPDASVARLLLSAVEDWAAARGMKHVHGPYNYCATQELGLLIGGFDSRPAAFQTHNPPYYRGLIEGCGYGVEHRMSAWSGDIAEIDRQHHPFFDAGRRVAASANIRVRTIDRGRYRADMEIVRQLFNQAFAANDEVLPFEEDVFHAQAAALRSLIRPELIAIAEREGTPVAFAVVIPDLNEVLVHLNGKIRLRDLLTLKKRLRAVRDVVILLIGAAPEIHGLGLGRALAAFMQVAFVGRYDRVHTTWIHESNKPSRGLVKRLGFREAKEYATFVKSL